MTREELDREWHRLADVVWQAARREAEADPDKARAGLRIESELRALASGDCPGCRNPDLLHVVGCRSEDRIMEGFVVKYKVAGFGEERTTPVYRDRPTAESHADDIRGFEGVEYAVAVPAEEVKKSVGGE